MRHARMGEMSMQTLSDRQKAAELVVCMLGGFQVAVEGHVIPDAVWRRRKAKHLVALLALTPSHSLHRDQVLDAFWPDAPPAAAANSLYQTLHIARRILCPTGQLCSYLTLREEMLSLSSDTSPWIDAEAFETAAKETRRGKDPAQYQAALKLYAGELLPLERYEDWAQAPRDRLQRTYLDLLLQLAELHQDRGEYAQAIMTLRRVVEVNPLQEEAHAGLMRLYASAGQRSSALAQYAVLAQVVRSSVGTEPAAEHTHLYQEILADRFPRLVGREQERATSGGQAPRTNLPVQMTSFVGREREKGDYVRLLQANRLITLTGPGGCGKTRLALEMGSALQDNYRDGVWLVELAALQDPALAPQAVATALGLHDSRGRPPLELLVAELQRSHMLIVLDNCEHLIEAAAQLGEQLLQACPTVRILATSREPLHAPGEIICLVPSLRLPDTAAVDVKIPETLLAYESVRLFSDRARAVMPDFEVSTENAGAVIEICLRLDGIPLALELAATRLRALSPDQIAARLEDAFSVLLGGSRTALTRQRTLRATIDWSYDLLSDGERGLFRRLAIFTGGFTIEAVEAICVSKATAPALLELFAQLVDKSLVTVDRDGASQCYHLLETIRQYAAERLQESGEAPALRQRHRDWYLALAEQSDAGLRGPEQGDWLNRLTSEHDNFRAVLRGALEWGEIEVGVRLAGALWRFWYMRGHVREGRERLEQLIARAEDAAHGGRPVTPETLARALNGAGTFADKMGEPRRAIELHERSLAMRRILGDRGAIAATLNDLANVLSSAGEYARAMTYYEEGLTLNRELGDEWGVALVLGNLGNCISEQGQYERAAAMFEEAHTLASRMGGAREIAYALNNLGDVSFRLGRLDAARDYFERGLALFREQADPLCIALSLLGLAHIARATGDASQATHLYAESLVLCGPSDNMRDAISNLEGIAGVLLDLGRYESATVLFAAASITRERLTLPSPPADRPRLIEALAAVRVALGEQAYLTSWAFGRAMSPEESAEYALTAIRDES
jgi:predicted ATPase/DNA-binding SARP family transcriptional activator